MSVQRVDLSLDCCLPETAYAQLEQLNEYGFIFSAPKVSYLRPRGLIIDKSADIPEGKQLK